MIIGRSRIAAWAVVAVVVIASADSASAHLGRRLRLSIEDGQIVAYGANTGAPDGLPNERPFAGVVHDHWTNYTLSSLPQPEFAQTFLPEFDVPTSVTGLVGRSLQLDLVGAWQWAHPMMSHHGHTTPAFSPLDPGEVIRIEGADNTWTDTVQMGSLLLSTPLPAGGDPDIPILYRIDGHPEHEIHVLKFVISSSAAPGGSSLRPSDPVYVLISPDGDTMEHRLHHESIFLEEYLASIPEPSSAALATVARGAAMVAARRRFSC